MIRVFFIILFTVISANSAEFIEFNVNGLGSISLPLHIVSEEDQQRLAKSINYETKTSIRLPRSLSLKSQFSSAPKAQGMRDNCSAFATISLVEFYDGGTYSEQCLCWLQHRKDLEFASVRIKWVVDNGLYFEKDCPYYESKDDNDIIPELVGKSKYWPSIDYVEVSQSIDDPINYLKYKISQGHPVIISFYTAGKDWNKKGIIGLPTPEEIAETCISTVPGSKYKKCGAHTSIVTGYDDDLKYLEFRNSWGNKWPAFPAPAGDGYGKMSYEYFLKMRLSHDVMVSK